MILFYVFVENNKYILTKDKISREDPLLVKCVEILGEKSFGRHAKLKIVEIPDNVNYIIEEYDGYESIHESHRSWS